MIRIITNLVFGAALLCLLPVASLQLFRCIVTFSDFVDWRPFALGLLPGMVLGEVTIRWIPQLHVLEHELTHAFVGLWFGAIPVGIKVTKTRGKYLYRETLPWLRPMSRPVVTLAPYFLPTTTAIMAFLRPAVGPHAYPWYDLAIGGTFAWHSVTTWREIRDNGAIRAPSTSDHLRGQITDFHQAGPVFSWIFIAFATIVAHGMILAVIARGYRGVAADLRGMAADVSVIRALFT